MSLEEVEASMAAQTKRSATNAAPQQRPSVPPTSISHDLYSEASASQYGDQARYAQPQRTDPRLSQYISHQPQTAQAELPAHAGGGPQILQRVKPPSQQVSEPRNTIQTQQTQPRQILQNPDRLQSQTGPTPVEPPTQSQAHSRVPSKGPAGLPQQISMITNPQQLMQLSEEERAAFLLEDAKRAKRNHKIYLLSKDNGLMTPKDKNWVTRIQLQQLMTSTGNVNDQDPGAALSEDFYYEVHNQIRGGPRQNPHQPLNHFAQTYLHQTGGRQSGFARRQNRGGDNHLQRMEQQVQRAVEAAKLKPKNKQLVIEGSLGKISFSNAKTPKPLLNIKRTDSGDVTNRPQSSGRQPSKAKIPQTEMSASDRKTVLRNIEKVYTSLMRIEDHERHTPASLLEDSEAALIEQHIEWRHTMKTLNQRLWQDLKVMEPINPGSSIPHPFIAFLSYPKGKKTIPRIFRHLDIEQRVTILTMIVVHLDSLDVISKAQPQLNEAQLPIAVREEVELFSQVVMPSLFGYVNEAPLNIVIGLLGLVLDRVNVQAVARTKVGLGILTMLLSRAEIVKQAGATNDQEWEQWSSFYHRLFDMLEPILSGIFPGSINSGEDMYVWQFLAAMGIGASPEEQQRLVIAVKLVNPAVLSLITILRNIQGSCHGHCRTEQGPATRNGKSKTRQRELVHACHWARCRATGVIASALFLFRYFRGSMNVCWVGFKGCK